MFSSLAFINSNPEESSFPPTKLYGSRAVAGLCWDLSLSMSPRTGNPPTTPAAGEGRVHVQSPLDLVQWPKHPSGSAASPNRSSRSLASHASDLASESFSCSAVRCPRSTRPGSLTPPEPQSLLSRPGHHRAEALPHQWDSNNMVCHLT